MHDWEVRIKPGTVYGTAKPDTVVPSVMNVFAVSEQEAKDEGIRAFQAFGAVVLESNLVVTRKAPHGKTFSGRVKSIEFDTGKVSIANKEKDFFYVRGRDIGRLCEIVLASPYQYATFELDGRIVESFRAYKGAQA